MQNLVIKIVKALSKIEHEKGPFIVKCLVARNPDDIQWDLVLAANWFDEDRIQRLNYLSKKVLCDFDSDTISQFSGIIAISPDSQLAQFLKKIQDEYKLYFGKRHVGEQRIIQTDNNQAPMVLSLVDFSIS
ncbi:MAG: hypothetical protein DRQ49_10890 [Gammaproteobacteria bacterium]|nr:MAG: hypothetical protein DRQ49_10890 [Gammaproteobacteria bacterium]RKZ73479.1 MAG: hypothetical protein DRQ57_14280 [Gammaproteobacteria bacterium]